MAFCDQCGSNVGSSDKTCSSCGHRLEDSDLGNVMKDLSGLAGGERETSTPAQRNVTVGDKQTSFEIAGGVHIHKTESRQGEEPHSYCRSCGVFVAKDVSRRCPRCGAVPLCWRHYKEEMGVCAVCEPQAYQATQQPSTARPQTVAPASSVGGPPAGKRSRPLKPVMYVLGTVIAVIVILGIIGALTEPDDPPTPPAPESTQAIPGGVPDQRSVFASEPSPEPTATHTAIPTSTPLAPTPTAEPAPVPIFVTPVSTPVPGPLQFDIWIDTDYGFAFDYPAEWTTSVQPEGFFATEPSGEAALHAIGEDAKEVYNLQEYVDQNIANLESLLAEFEVISVSSQLTINEVPAVIIDYSGTDDYTRVRGAALIALKDDEQGPAGVVVQILGDASAFDKYMEVFDRAVDSLYFFPGSRPRATQLPPDSQDDTVPPGTWYEQQVHLDEGVQLDTCFEVKAVLNGEPDFTANPDIFFSIRDPDGAVVYGPKYIVEYGCVSLMPSTTGLYTFYFDNTDDSAFGKTVIPYN